MSFHRPKLKFFVFAMKCLICFNFSGVRSRRECCVFAEATLLSSILLPATEQRQGWYCFVIQRSISSSLHLMGVVIMLL